MTEKRFGVITNWCIYENVNGVEKWLTFDKVVELLNELHEENQELKQLIRKMGELGGFNKHMIKTICEGLE